MTNKEAGALLKAITHRSTAEQGMIMAHVEVSILKNMTWAEAVQKYDDSKTPAAMKMAGHRSWKRLMEEVK